jgi:hypothetical protein
MRLRPTGIEAKAVMPRDEVADQDGFAAVSLEHLACLIQIRPEHELEALDPPDELAQSLLTDPEPG